MADSLLSGTVGLTMLAVSGSIIAYSTSRTKKESDESRIPLMGVAGAFVFAAQMINFTIPGTGSSGHITGGILLAALLGPAAGFIVMAGVLLVQALFFADGGLLAYGCNLFNIGFFSCFLAYPYIFRPIAGKTLNRSRIMLASCISCVIALQLGALSVTLETLASGVTALPFGAFIAAMLPIHLAIGLGEGLATGCVLSFLAGNLPEYSELQVKKNVLPKRAVIFIFGLAALVIGGGLSLAASENPDGLEWSMERVAGTAELEATGLFHDFFAKISEFCAVLPDYAFPGSESVYGTVFSGVAGVIICIALMMLCGLLIIRRKRSHALKASESV